MDIDISGYKRVGSKNGGEYSGPCYFTGEGDDRFIMYPFEIRNGKPRPNWFCRHGCTNCPGKPTSSGGHWGLFVDDVAPFVPLKQSKEVKERKVPNIKEAMLYKRLLTKESVKYLNTRGISNDVIKAMHIGTYRGGSVTFPNIINIEGIDVSYGIKYRVLPHKYIGGPKYRMITGSRGKTIYNFNILKKYWNTVIIVESIMDVLLLSSLNMPAVCPFGGGGIWSTEWYKFFDCETIINIGDRDENMTGQNFGPGEMYANRRAIFLSQKEAKYKHVITALPPKPYSDIGEMHESGEDIKKWLIDLYAQNIQRRQ